MLFTILGFFGSVLIIVYYLTSACEGTVKVVEVCHGPLPDIKETNEDFDVELEKELNNIVDEERDKMISTIRRRLKPS